MNKNLVTQLSNKFHICFAEVKQSLLDNGSSFTAMKIDDVRYILKSKVTHYALTGKVAPYKKLRGGVKFVKEIPKSPSGKILRRLIKEAVRNEFKSKL